MGRLFWHFFVCVAIAQLAVALLTGLLLRWNGPPGGLEPRGELRAAAVLLERTGTEGFESWANRADGPPMRVLAIDAAGQEVLRRDVPPGQLQRLQAARLAPERYPGVLAVTAPDGKRYWLLNDTGPGGPPGGPPGWMGPLGPPGPFAGALACSVLAAWLLALYVARPIRTLRHAFNAVAAGDLDRRVSDELGDRRDELGDLGADFDRMTGRLKLSIESQRRLLHDVSHELRSPLARVQAAVGLLREEPELMERMAERIETEIARIDELVDHLLCLSRLEAGGLDASQQQDVDLHELLADIISDTCFEAQAGGSAVTWVEEGPRVTVHGVAALLQIAIGNVLRNAFKHGGGTGVRIETDSREGLRCRIRILDEGPGLSPQDLERIFFPFFRGRQASAPGYGLGLAIARRSIEAHRGTIQASNRESRGLCVQIVLPCQAAGTPINETPSPLAWPPAAQTGPQDQASRA